MPDVKGEVVTLIACEWGEPPVFRWCVKPGTNVRECSNPDGCPSREFVPRSSVEGGELERLQRALYACFKASGSEDDGISPLKPEEVVQAVEQLRRDYDEAVEGGLPGDAVLTDSSLGEGGLPVEREALTDARGGVLGEPWIVHLCSTCGWKGWGENCTDDQSCEAWLENAETGEHGECAHLRVEPVFDAGRGLDLKWRVEVTLREMIAMPYKPPVADWRGQLETFHTLAVTALGFLNREDPS